MNQPATWMYWALTIMDAEAIAEKNMSKKGNKYK